MTKMNVIMDLNTGAVDLEPGICRIEKYLKQVKTEIHKTGLKNCVMDFISILEQAKTNDREVIFFGTAQDYHIANHANADFLKANNLKIISFGIPTITAFGNDYPFPNQLREILRQRNFGNKNVLIGIQFDENNSILEEAFKYNYEHHGINILITNLKISFPNIDLVIDIDTENKYIARDITQIILHFVSTNIAYKNDSYFSDRGGGSFSNYCELLLESINSLDSVSKNMAEISLSLQNILAGGRNIFVFGNGGSAALASFFADGLREELAFGLNRGAKIFDITAFVGNITNSISQGCYQGSAFTQIIQSLGVMSGDMLIGISSSGNSENIIHPFVNLKETIRVGIIGFDDGGVIGRTNIKDLAVIVPDAGGFRSYQRAEDGQRIVISSILSTFSASTMT